MLIHLFVHIFFHLPHSTRPHLSLLFQCLSLSVFIFSLFFICLSTPLFPSLSISLSLYFAFSLTLSFYHIYPPLSNFLTSFSFSHSVSLSLSLSLLSFPHWGGGGGGGSSGPTENIFYQPKPLKVSSLVPDHLESSRILQCTSISFTNQRCIINVRGKWFMW